MIYEIHEYNKYNKYNKYYYGTEFELNNIKDLNSDIVDYIIKYLLEQEIKSIDYDVDDLPTIPVDVYYYLKKNNKILDMSYVRDYYLKKIQHIIDWKQELYLEDPKDYYPHEIRRLDSIFNMLQYLRVNEILTDNLIKEEELVEKIIKTPEEEIGKLIKTIENLKKEETRDILASPLPPDVGDNIMRYLYEFSKPKTKKRSRTKRRRSKRRRSKRSRSKRSRSKRISKRRS